MSKIVFVFIGCCLFACGVFVGAGVSGSFNGTRVIALEQTIARQKLDAVAARSERDAELRRASASVADAQKQSAVAASESRRASKQFEDYRNRVGQIIAGSTEFAGQLSLGLGTDIDIVNRCLSIVDKLRESLEGI